MRSNPAHLPLAGVQKKAFTHLPKKYWPLLVMIKQEDGTWMKVEPEKLSSCFQLFDLNGMQETSIDTGRGWKNIKRRAACCLECPGDKGET
jgi:hypothetical protein